MLGLRRFSRRYRRFRYNYLARYPRLFVVVEMLTFPFQIALVALPLWFAVGQYDKHFSYEAKKQRSTASLDALAKDFADTSVKVERRVVAATGVKPESAEPSIRATALADALKNNAESAQTSGFGATSAANNLKADPVAAPVTTATTDKEAEVGDVIAQLTGTVSISRESRGPLKDGGWIAQQADASYVIQLESSANLALMQKQARQLLTADNLAVYPYKVSVKGETIYGLSYGLYRSLSEARAASEKLPEELTKFGTWIRKVSKLKTQLNDLESESTRLKNMNYEK